MALANTLDTLNGLFKEVYAKELKDLIPDGVVLYNMIPFAQKEAALGNFYHQPVVLGQEHGVTFAGSGDDAFALNDAVAGAIKDATIRGTQMVLRSVLGYASASRSSGGGAKAFKDATKFLVGNMLRSVTKKLEIELLYGQVGYATLGAQGPSTSVVIPDAQWAPGIWAGAENMPIDIRDSAGGNSRLRVVQSVDFDTKTIVVDSAVTIAANDVIHHKGAYGNEFAGIHKILSNTGTLFGIDAANYTLWKGNSYSAAGALSFTKLQEAIARGVEKGLDSDVMVVVNPRTWADLLNDQAAARQYDSSYSSAVAEQGSRTIKFHGQNGMIEIVPSIYCKEGFAYILDKSCFMRVGSTEVTFKRPGKGDEFFRELDAAAGYELRAYTDQALFCNSPGRNVLVTGIS